MYIRSNWAIIAIAFPALCGSAQIFNPTPDWASSDMQASTGAALVDLNLDGWLDLVVANGNDVSVQRVVVYYNTGSGTLQNVPGWRSADVAYHGHVAIADVNGDGWPDVAVAVVLAQGGTSAKVYLNSNGTVLATPSWSGPVSADSMGVSFGDMNGDGRPDLAVASGEAYNNVPRRNCVYLNTGTSLSSVVSWETATPRNFNNCLWVDADFDGRLDLCYTGSGSQSFIYRNLGEVLETAPSWSTSMNGSQFSLMAAVGDVTGDGRRDLFLCDNNQIFGGSGRFWEFDGLASGFFAPGGNWHYFDGYASAIALGDLNDDGALDLCTGEWFGRTRYFLNGGAGLGGTPAWTATGTSTVEKIVLGDIDNSARRVEVATFPTAGTRRLFHLPRQPVESVMTVVVDGAVLPPAGYVYDREQGWVALGVTAQAEVRVVYVYSHSLDMAVANSDVNKPNQAYMNQSTAPCPGDFNLDGFVDGIDYDLFINAFEAGMETADFNIDGFLDGIDYDRFMPHFEAGC